MDTMSPSSDSAAMAKALKRALAIAGSQEALATICRVTQPAVSKWLAKGQPLPAELVLLVERETGVPKEELRPDIYPPHLAAGTSPDALLDART
jgi:DNA-binding transcriptional regulator YdaS (Cro superfamily)